MSDVPAITVAQFAGRRDEDLVLLDVREPWELDICHLDKSVNIPLQALPARAAEELPQDKPIVVMCHHGGRSAKATAWLRQNGFVLATNLAGGIDAWAAEIEPSLTRY